MLHAPPVLRNPKRVERAEEDALRFCQGKAGECESRSARETFNRMHVPYTLEPVELSKYKT